ncbi:MAG: ABC transporter permease [Candidatus Izemoplasmatales bacterium]|jgi:ABC-type dipeptide/oligopeptide/nickel transport system permease component|nr:ABC transporter permease [Candidatus Izemoplasmatales bacterium]NLF48652.1 ABC transporter permease [Acholeplasmataceae bacterium]MDD4355528.1 ABC transporter permease [Candidatus Izemoplasmatales bacterium]MDD4988664.1 ABC transporter permease [Candidatus Izemoplasmatales bacterium]MDD5602399.1 ABC transporter permease [Candidatus Izemoplasmatales bacterium]
MQKSYLIKRILYAIFIFFVVMVLNFFIPRIGVDDPAERYYPPQGNMTDVEYDIIKQVTREQYGFDVSNLQQFLNYAKGLFQGDLGTSFRPGNPKVSDLIAERLPWTLVLSVTNLLISLFIGLMIGTIAAWRRGRWQDTLLLNMSTISTALPAFFLALILSFYFGFELELFPAYTNPNMVSGFDWSWEAVKVVMYNAALPIISMSIGGIIGYGQGTRNAVIAVTNEDFILTARAKGLSRNQVIFKHTLRNAMLPIVTSLGMSISGLIGGAVIIEQIFNWNGMGTLFLEANNTNDYPLMMGIMLFMSAFAIVANLVTELCYSLLDPRVTVGEKR